MNFEKSDQISIGHKKEEFLYAILSLILSIIILLIIDYVIFLIYKPDIDEIIQQAISISRFGFDKSLFAPEPVERTQYIISVFLSPFIVFLSYRYINKASKKIDFFSKKIDSLYLIGVLGTTLCVIFLCYFINYKDKFFYLQNTPVLDNFPFYAVFLFPGILFFIAIAEKNSSANKLFSILLGICSFILMGMLFFMTIFNKNQYIGGIPHLEAIFYSVAQVFGGKTLLVDFINQYGLYPHFLDPIFHIIGLTVLNFSIVMSFLTAISLTSIFFFLKKTISNNVVSFLGFSTIVFFSVLSLVTQDVYFQYWPVRTIFPALFIILASIYLKEKNRIIYYCLCILTSIAVLWNLDSGVVVFLSWGLLLGYCELFQQDIMKTIKNWWHHFFTVLSIFSIVIICFILYIFTRSGSFPNFFEFVQYQQFFYISGFYMIPMGLFHPWNAIIIIYICGLLYATNSIIKKDNSYIAKVIFLLSILGFGLFSYYQGRSHDDILPLVSYPAILLLTIFTDIFLLNLKKLGFRLYHNLIFVIMLVFILSISICSIGYHFNQYYKFSERGFSALNDSQTTIISENIDFIKNSAEPGEKIFILANYNDGIYYGESHTLSALNIPGLAEILYIKDYDKQKFFLMNNTDIKVFVELPNHDPQFNEILNQNYSIYSLSSSHQMALLYRDFNKEKNQFFFKNEPNTIYHESSEIFYNQKKINLNNYFTIQVLVRPYADQVPYATILGSHPGTNNFEGFVIQQANLSQNNYSYIFGTGKSWESPLKFHLDDNEWNYLVIIAEDEKIFAYNNGILINSTNLGSTIKNSDIPLDIGNWIGNDRAFNGVIKEVMISNSSLSTETIKSNWEYVQKNV